MVPNDWCIVNLKDVTTKIQDGNYGADYPKKEELLPSGIPFLTSKVLGGDGKINASKYDFISSEKHVSLKKAQITTNDILFTNRGANVGVVAVAGSDLADANIGPQLTLIRVDRNLSDNDYLYFFMKSPFFQRQVKGQDSGSAMNFFGIKATEKFKIILPPLPEQRKIAKILSTWDKAISTTERLIDNSKQQKKALMQQLLTGKKRLLDDSGKPFEGEWKEGRVRDLVRSLDAGISVNSEDDNNLNASYKILKTSCVSSGKFQLSETKSVINEDEISRLKEPVVSDSIILSRMNTPALVGANGYIEYEIPNTFLPDRLWQVKPNNNCVHMKWLGHWFASTHTRYTLSSAATGTSGSMKNITKPDVLNIKVAIPSLSEQYKIATVLTNADKEIELLEQQHADLKQEKKALMQQLLTGKRRVKVEQTDLKAN